jgi:hypothetical protein
MRGSIYQAPPLECTIPTLGVHIYSLSWNMWKQG